MLQNDNQQEKHDVFKSVYKARYKELLTYARRLCGDWQRAEDATQETFVAFFRHMEDVAPESRRAWLYVALRNKTFDSWRKTSKDPFGETDEATLDAAPNPRRPAGGKFDAADDAIERKNDFDAIVKTVRNVREKLQRVGKDVFSATEKDIYYWTFCVIPPLELDELAYVLRLSRDSVGALRRRALGKIRDLFREETERQIA